MGLELAVSIACILVTAVILLLLTRSSGRKVVADAPQPAPQPAAIEVASAPGSKCSDCAHFDKEEGQAILRLYPAFPRMDLPPCLIGAQYDKDTGGLKRNEAVPARCSWDDFGACALHTELRWSEDACPDFKRRLRAA